MERKTSDDQLPHILLSFWQLTTLPNHIKRCIKKQPKKYTRIYTVWLAASVFSLRNEISGDRTNQLLIDFLYNADGQAATSAVFHTG